MQITRSLRASVLIWLLFQMLAATQQASIPPNEKPMYTFQDNNEMSYAAILCSTYTYRLAYHRVGRLYM